jgi:MFS transporter, MHS family, shikimate and dehydroshikimate transport protein
MVVEHAPPERRGFYGSWPQVGPSAGTLLSTGVFAIVSSLPQDQFLAWGWRVPFLLSAVVVVVGLVIRLTIAESPVFEEIKESHREARRPGRRSWIFSGPVRARTFCSSWACAWP